MFWEINVPKISKNIERLQARAKSFENTWVTFGKVAGPQFATLSKDKLPLTPLKLFFNWFIYLLRTAAYQGKLQRKE